MKLSILVPFRDADGTRTKAKHWILRRWAHFWPDAEIVVASDDGVDPFNKCIAVNKAAAQATGDMFAILDADTWIDPKFMHSAFERIAKGIPWVIPASRSMRLKKEASEMLMKLDPTGDLPLIQPRLSEQTGPVVGFLWVMPRAAFEAVGGMDERIRGWGGEDTSFTRAMDVVVGPHRKLNGTVVCLWHERPRQGKLGRIWLGQDRTQEQDKAVLMHAYAAARSKTAMLEVLGR